MATATRKPLSASQGSGHHSGSPWKPRLPGRSVKISVWTLLDCLEEEVGDGRHREADDGSEHQEREIAPGLEELERIGGRWRLFRWGCRVRHDVLAGE